MKKVEIGICEHSKDDGWFYICFEEGGFAVCKDCLNKTSGYKDYFAYELGAKGGKKGGIARAAMLTPERRKEIAVNAAKARWQKKGERG